MTNLYSVRRSQPARGAAVRPRAPTPREVAFLSAIAAGDIRPKRTGAAGYYCLRQGWIEPLVAVADRVTTLRELEAEAEADPRRRAPTHKIVGFALTDAGRAALDEASPPLAVAAGG